MYKCEFCYKEFKRSSGKHINTCKKNPNKVKRVTSEKTKKLLSEKQKKAFKEGRAKGWSHINNDPNKRSYPEKWFIKNVLEKYQLNSKYTIKEKIPFGKYFLDFAFLELKLDVEIDGKQHFGKQSAVQHDIDRDAYLIQQGWKIYRIAWIEITENTDKIIKDFLLFLETNNLYRTYNKEELLKHINKHKPKYGTRKDYIDYLKKQRLIINNVKINKIINSDINFSKRGWSKKISQIILIDPNNITHWMKRNMLEFYNKNILNKAL